MGVWSAGVPRWRVRTCEYWGPRASSSTNAAPVPRARSSSTSPPPPGRSSPSARGPPASSGRSPSRQGRTKTSHSTWEDLQAMAKATKTTAKRVHTVPKPKKPRSPKYVYDFEQGNRDMKDLLGGKGANLGEMTSVGLPVPHGFTITTRACNQYLA